jgi:hypothetical protein
MGDVSKYTGPDRKSHGQAGNGTQRRAHGGWALRRSAAGHPGTSPPMLRDNHNVIQRQGMKK